MSIRGVVTSMPQPSLALASGPAFKLGRGLLDGDSAFMGDSPAAARYRAMTHVVYQDPSLSRGLFISDDGQDGLIGSRQNFLRDIFPDGEAPRDTQAILRLMGKEFIYARLRRGTIYAWLQQIPGTFMPRFNALAYLPVDAKDLFNTLWEVREWEYWMPKFRESQMIPTPNPRAKIQRARIEVGDLTLQFQVELRYADVNGLGRQIFWEKQEEPRFKLAEGAVGVHANAGSMTFVPVPNRNASEPATLMAYQVHFDPEEPLIYNYMFRAEAIALVEKLFDKAIRAIANRTLYPMSEGSLGWLADSLTNPCRMNYNLLIVEKDAM